MKKAGLIFTRLRYDNSAWRIALCAQHLDFTGALEIYIHPKDLAEFGARLASFPSHTSDEVQFDLGSPDGNFAYHLMLRARCCDRAGHAVLEVVMDNRAQGPDHAQASFSIRAEAASLNELGRRLGIWVAQSDEPLEWLACNG